MTTTCKTGMTQEEADAMTLADFEAATGTEPVFGEALTGTKNDTVTTFNVSVDGTTNDRYYLVADYVNKTDGSQDAQQGKTFTLTIGYNAGDTIGTK